MNATSLKNQNTLKNQDETWKSNVFWELPPPGSNGYIKNVGTQKFLSVVTDANHFTTKVVEETFGKNPGLKWKRGTSDNEGYFTLKNIATGKLLTAQSKGGFRIEGTYGDISLFFKCL